MMKNLEDEPECEKCSGGFRNWQFLIGWRSNPITDFQFGNTQKRSTVLQAINSWMHDDGYSAIQRNQDRIIQISSSRS